MLFSSTHFIFVFLPLVLVGFHLCRIKFGPEAGRYLLVFASLVFYGWWNPVYVPLILLSMTVNYSLGSHIASSGTSAMRKRGALIAGIVFNILLLGYFKYTGFLVGAVSGLLLDYPLTVNIVLPLAISFFTFQQIAFLVDVYRNNDIMADTGVLKYLCFVLFFPQLIAGPIVHHKQLVPQLSDTVLNKVTSRHLMLGLAVFSLGLFKKVVLADQIAEISIPIFERQAEGRDLHPRTAWIGILAFTFRLYFDFSAYSDMAFGLGLMFGIILPVNFFSPYKAGNINETWARWNITLGHFFGSYVFKPLGGRSRGRGIAARNVIILMLLSGAWHGAGWNYLIWGLMNGLAMAWLVFWPDIMKRLGLEGLRGKWVYDTLFCVGVTFIFWIFSLVAFRVTRVDDMLRYFDSLFSISLADLSSWGTTYTEQLAGLAGNLASGGPVESSAMLLGTSWILVSLVIVFLLPNVLQFFAITRNGRIGRAELTPIKAIVAGLLGGLAIAMTITSESSEFIYFVF